MFTSIKCIDNYGTFESIRDIQLKKNTIIFAPNGSGKTTFSLIFQSLMENNADIIAKKRRFNSDDGPLIKLATDLKSSAGNTECIVFSKDNWHYKFDLLDNPTVVFNNFYFEKNNYSFRFTENEMQSILGNNENLMNILSRYIKLTYDIYSIEKQGVDRLREPSKLQQLKKKLSKIKCKNEEVFNTFDKFVVNFKDKVNEYLEKYMMGIYINETKLRYFREVGRQNAFSIIFSLTIRDYQGTLDTRSLTSFDYILSEGNKNAIAVCSFLAKLDLVPISNNLNVVVDDPFTSFDMTRKDVTIQLLTSASQKVSQFILLTHDSLFGEEIYERLVKLGKKEETTTIELYNTGNNVVIREVDFYTINLSPFVKNLEILNDYVMNGSRDEYHDRLVYSTLRVTLEGIFRIKYYKYNSKEVWLNSYIKFIEASEENGKYREMYRLKPLLTDLKLVINYSNSPHHDNSYRGTNNVIYSERLMEMTKKTLELVYKI